MRNSAVARKRREFGLHIGAVRGIYDWANLRPWPKLTLGKPSALEGPPGAAELEAEIASLTGVLARTIPSNWSACWRAIGN